MCVQEAPYVMLKKNAELFQDNDRYEGMLLIRGQACVHQTPRTVDSLPAPFYTHKVCTVFVCVSVSHYQATVSTWPQRSQSTAVYDTNSRS